MRRKWIWIVAAIVVFLGIGAVKSNQDKKAAEESRSMVAATVETAAPTATPKPTAKPTATPAPTPELTPKPTATPAPTAEPTPTAPPVKDYVLNTNTMKFHKTSCSSVKDIAEWNRKDFTGTREDVIAMGYQPCGKCHP